MRFLSLLTILFIGLKLTGYIDWSWWYVTMPLWLIPVFMIGFTGIIGTIAGLVSYFVKDKGDKKCK